ncbi:MAG: BamA/TamA family outer membrane protein [Crocinitomicaceae bacterium]
MVFKQNLHSVLICFLFLGLMACNQAKYVPSGKYLYKIKPKKFFRSADKSTIHFLTQNDSVNEISADYKQILTDDLYDLLKPQPNRSFNLFVYNRIDTLKMQEQIAKKSEKTLAKNNKRIVRQNAINKKRNQKAKSKDETHFFKKNIRLKKTRFGWRHWVSLNIGEAPVIMDSLKVSKSAKQIHLYLKKRGFYDNDVSESISYNAKKRKAFPIYTITPRRPITIASLKFDSDPKYKGLKSEYYSMLRKKDSVIFIGDILDEDKLDIERDRFSKFCRDDAYFNFSKSYVYFEVDTTIGDFKANVIMRIIPKTEEDKNGNVKELKHSSYKVSDLTYRVHNPNAKSFKNFDIYEEKLKIYGLSVQGGDFPLLDTLNYRDSVFKKKYVFFGRVDTLIYKGTFIYNEKLPISPFLIDRQNFLEITTGGDNGWYKEYYVERSYSRLLGLDIFSSIAPIIDPSGSRTVSISYDLTPSNKQTFSFEPNLTNSNGYLGLAASVNYTNKNIFGGAEKLKVSITGGAESQPAVFDRNLAGDAIKLSNRQFNTIEIFPKISLEFPRLLPMSKRLQKTLGKRLYPLTVLDLSYNYQKRTDFTRNLTEFAYSWKFNEGKTKTHQIKWQSFNFVKLDKSSEFEILLSQLDDPFLINTYNDHFSNKFEYIFTYNNQRVNSEVGKKNYIFGTATGTSSGYLFDISGVGQNNIDSTTGNDLKQVLGVPFTQFVKVDFDIRYYMNLIRSRPNKQLIAYRLLAGLGYAYGNSPSLPYEESFFAGGSNDIRAFTARTMAPGGTQTWRDTNSTNTQVSDIRLELNVEYRFQFSDFIKAAIFVDAGNIWKLTDDPESTDDDLSVFSSNFTEQVALGTGFGLRLDFDFFIVRLDLAVPLHNPYMFAGERWLWEKRTKYAEELETLPTTYIESLRSPFRPNLSFGIGYPF